ncbi:MAG TPA: hypothetical protein VGX21_13995 [Methylomirabilota bacterium]|nr:hypothetical protein [Methylomirabilota bacterium]
MSRRHHRHRTRVGKRALELLRTRRLVWAAAVVVNAATAVAARNRGLPGAAAVALGSALLTSFAVWLLSYFAIRRRHLVVVERRISVRRMAALVLAVFLASVLTGASVRLGIALIEQAGERPPEEPG